MMQMVSRFDDGDKTYLQNKWELQSKYTERSGGFNLSSNDIFLRNTKIGLG
jgi:hypothetical protein